MLELNKQNRKRQFQALTGLVILEKSEQVKRHASMETKN